MEYERINWENFPSQETPINANNLNRIDFALYLLASSENTVILDVTGVSAGETLIHVSIPYGVEYVYEVIVT